MPSLIPKIKLKPAGTKKRKKRCVLKDQEKQIESKLNEHNSLINELLETERSILNVTDDGSFLNHENESVSAHHLNGDDNATPIATQAKWTNDNSIKDTPIVCDYKFKSFLKSLNQPLGSEYEKDLNVCLTNMNHDTVNIQSKIALLQAIRDSILKRKWNNLTFLLNIATKNQKAFTSIFPIVSINQIHNNGL